MDYVEYTYFRENAIFSQWFDEFKVEVLSRHLFSTFVDLFIDWEHLFIVEYK